MNICLCMECDCAADCWNDICGACAKNIHYYVPNIIRLRGEQ